jgi:hypothetical protein
MAGPRVPVLAPDPKTGRMRFATVDESEVDIVVSGGGKRLSKGEAAEQEATQREDARYEAGGTLGKIAGGLTTAAGIATGNPLMVSGAPGSAGAAVNRGVASGMTAGLGDAGVRQSVDALGGHAAGDRYAQQFDDTKRAHETAFGAGELAGLAGGAALPATPAGLLGKFGGAAERGAGLLTKGLRSGGALSRAAGAGVELGARGAIEGAAYAGVQSAADDIVHDLPINGDKLYTAVGHGALAGGALGFGLGATGSLAASGARAAKAGIVRRLAGGAEEGAAAQSNKLGDVLKRPDAAAHGAAQEQAWKAIGAGYGLQSTKYAKQASKYFPNGTKDLGEVAIRHGVLEIPQGMTPTQAALHAGRTGTPAEMLPRAEAALEHVGKRIGDITDASGAKVQAPQIMQIIDEVAKPYEASAATRPVGRSIRSFGAELLDSLGMRDLNSAAGVKDVLRERRAIDRLAFQDAPTLDPRVALEARRNLRTKLEGVITDAMDSASGQVPGTLKAEYKTLKKDYHALSIINEALEDSAARAAKGATLGLGEKFAVAQAVATGNFAAAPILGIGGKLLRERGNAAAAAFLSRAAEQKAFSRLLRQTDEAVAAASAGIIGEARVNTPRKVAAGPTKRTSGEIADAKAETKAMRDEARAVMNWHAETTANPKKLQAALAEASEVVGRVGGKQAAVSYSVSAVRAVTFVSKYVPQKERRDPLDPRSVPPLTYDEADSLVRAYKYAAHPMTVWTDFAKGKVTPEGLDAAQSLQPEQFEIFRAQLLDHVTAHMLRNGQLTQSQRLRIDKVLGMPAGADLRPEAIARFQANFDGAPPEPDQGPKPDASRGGPVNMQIQQSGFDAVEARKAR